MKSLNLVTLGLFGAANIIFASQVQACTGAKQMGAGGTGVTTAENADAAYWNPGLACLLDQPEICYTRLVQGISDFRYANVLSFAMPVGERFGLTAQYVNSDTVSSMNKHEMWDWYSLGGGAKISDWPADLYLGGIISYNNLKSGGLRSDGSTKILDRNNHFRFDASLLAAKKEILIKNDELRFGILLQYADELDITIVRPEISYSLKDSLGVTTVAVAGYGLGNNSAALRVGGERSFNTSVGKFSVRAGYDGTLNNENQCLTVGLGYDSGKFGVDVANSDGKMTVISGFYRF